MNACYLGIDVGLSGTRAVVIDGRGEPLGFGRNGGPLSDTEGDAEAWLAGAVEAARLAVREAAVDRVDGIGIGALGPTPVVVDGSGLALFKSPLFGIDARSEDVRADICAKLGLRDDELGADHALPKIEWLKRAFPDRFSKAVLCTDLTGFLVGRMTGRFVMDHITHDYYGAAGWDWSLPLAEAVDPGAVAGHLRKDVANAMGILPGTPVAAGSIDSYVDIAGVGATAIGQSVLLAGTTLILGQIVETDQSRDGLRVTKAIGGHRFLGGWTSAFGSALDWSSSAFREALDGGAAPSPLLMLPYLAGERAPVWDSQASGVLLGLRDTISPEALSTAVRDGVVLTALDIAERVTAQAGAASHYLASGGALQVPHVAQSLADALSASIDVIDCGHARAAAMLAARAGGVHIPPRLKQAYHPVAAMHDAWVGRLAIYRDLYAVIAPIMHRWTKLIEREQQCPVA